MNPDLLLDSINEDIANGYQPLCIVAAIGTTGTMAVDPLNKIVEISEKKLNIWLHVDAAYAGSALLLPEYQELITGIEKADSFVFNAHKWLFTNFDCSVYFVKDKNALVNTFEILPEYSNQKQTGLINHSNWGVPLGRRFRSLKLWFVMRYYGLEGLQNKLRFHIELAKWLENEIVKSSEFELVVPRSINLVCFHFKPQKPYSIKELNNISQELLHTLNATGPIYLTHTKINGIFTLRMSVGQTKYKTKSYGKIMGVTKKESHGRMINISQ